MKKELRKKDIKATVLSLEDFDPVGRSVAWSAESWLDQLHFTTSPMSLYVPLQEDLPAEKLAVFIMACYGRVAALTKVTT